jgi:hypothetical protein
MGFFGLRSAPAPEVSAPAKWRQDTLSRTLTQLNPRRTADRAQAERYRSALIGAIQVEARGTRFCGEVKRVLEAPRHTLPIQLIIYREYYEYVSRWLRAN